MRLPGSFTRLPCLFVGVHCPRVKMERQEKAIGDRTIGQDNKQLKFVKQHNQAYILAFNTYYKNVGFNVSRIIEKFENKKVLLPGWLLLRIIKNGAITNQFLHLIGNNFSIEFEQGKGDDILKEVEAVLASSRTKMNSVIFNLNVSEQPQIIKTFMVISEGDMEAIPAFVMNAD